MDISFHAAREIISDVESLGIDLKSVSQLLESQGVEAFESSFENLLETLSEKAERISS